MLLTLDAQGEILLKRAISRFGLSTHVRHCALKAARTVADLAGACTVDAAHVAEAAQYRCFDCG